MRRIALGGILPALALLVSSMALASQSANPATYRTIDVSLVQLRVPSRWDFNLAGSGCHRTGSCRGAVLPGSDSTINIAQVPPRGCSGSERVNSIWIVRTSVQVHKLKVVSKIRCGAGVRVSDRSLGVIVYGFGTQGIAAAESAEPSGLAQLLAATLSARTTGKPLTYEHFVVGVPRAWPVVHLGRTKVVPDPGACGFEPFPKPKAYVGVSGVVLFCPDITWASSESSSATPDNGVWLYPISMKIYAAGQVGIGPMFVYNRQVGGVTMSIARPVRLSGSGSVVVTLRSGGSRVLMELGLGTTARVALGILESVRVHSAST